MARLITGPQGGGTTFFTARLADRDSILLTQEIEALRAAMRQTLRRYPFTIDAIAVLPSVLHTIWTLPPGDTHSAVRWRMIKSRFAKALAGPDAESTGQRRAANKGIWQPTFWEHQISNMQDFEMHLKMVHTSPVQAGLCRTPQDWPHSSIHRDAVKGAPTVIPAQAKKLPWPIPPQKIPTYREEGFHHSL